MKEPIKLLLKLNKDFRKHINAYCVQYKYQLRKNVSHPKWIALYSINYVGKTLLFKAAEDSKVSFIVSYAELPPEERELLEQLKFLDMYDYFSKLKSFLIENNHSSIMT